MRVPLYSAKGQSRVSSNPLIINQNEPNVGQFGWTSSDLESVTDIVKWVDTAQQAAVSASQSAEYAEQVYNEMLTIKADVDSAVENVNTSLSDYSKQFDEKLTKMDADLVQANSILQTIEGHVNFAGKISDYIYEVYGNIKTIYGYLETAFPDIDFPPLPDDPEEPEETK